MWKLKIFSVSCVMLSSISVLLAQTVPHTFSPNTPAKASEVNENFEFLASELREISINCNEGEAITDAINSGYNVLTITGDCYGAFHVYAMDVQPFGMAPSEVANKPISRLTIKGSEENRLSRILPHPTINLNSLVTSSGFLQLYNLTLVDRLMIGDNSMAYLNEVSYDSSDHRLSAYGNSYLRIDNSTISGEIMAGESSVITIKNSTITGHQDNEYEALSLDRNSHLETESSVINGYVSVWWGSTYHDDSSQIDCLVSSEKSCVYGTYNSSIDLNNTTINSITNFGLEAQWNSLIYIYETEIINSNGNHIHLNAMSSLQADGNSGHLMNVDCGLHVYIQDQTLTNNLVIPQDCW